MRETQVMRRYTTAVVWLLVVSIAAAGSPVFAAAEEAPPAAAATHEGAAPAEEAVTVPMTVRYPHGWMSWVRAVTGCLRALGVECDPVDVAGYSGFAFSMTVNENVNAGGVYQVEYGVLEAGLRLIGRSTVSYHGVALGGSAEDYERALEMVKAEVEAGRPCVIEGALSPEFSIVYGVQGDSYLVRSWQPSQGLPEPPARYDELRTPAWVSVLTFPTEAEPFPQHMVDKWLVARGLDLLNYQTCRDDVVRGLAAYDTWIAALESGEMEVFGACWTPHVWRESKELARDFLARVAWRNEAVAGPLEEAVDAYWDVTDAFGEVCDLFPFSLQDPQLPGPEVRAEAIEHLRAAKAAETRAAAAMARAVEMWPAE
jgi:hypothetical protein